MILSDKKILEEIKQGNVVIEPFIRSNLSTSSYDVTLGDQYFIEQEPDGVHTTYNPYDESDVKRVWGEKAIEAKYAKDIFDGDIPYNSVKEDDKVIILKPNETILAHTNEFIGGKNNITTMMKARSSLGRNFIEVCKCAGWGDVGYINRWTMEITNNSRYYSVILIVGKRVAQIVFLETYQIEEDDYSKKGKYQTTKDLEELKKLWDPMSMLPKMYKDREIKK